MLLKIVSIGLEATALNLLLAQLRDLQIRHGMIEFHTSAQLSALQTTFLPCQWPYEDFDFIFCNHIIFNHQPLRDALSSLPVRQPEDLNPTHPPHWVFCSNDLQHDFQELIQNSPVTFQLLTGEHCTVTHPSLITNAPIITPAPTALVDHWISAVRWHDKKGQHDLPVHNLPIGDSIGFAELTAIHDGILWRSPDQWLKKCLQQLRKPWPSEHATPQGLLRTEYGIALHAGISVRQIKSFQCKNTQFAYLFSSQDALPSLHRILSAFKSRWHSHCEYANQLPKQLRLAENKADLQVGLLGGAAAIRKRLFAVMQKAGFNRLFEAEQLKEGAIREPTLLLLLDGQPTPLPQIVPPLSLSLQASLAQLLDCVNTNIDWQQLSKSPIILDQTAASTTELTSELNVLQREISATNALVTQAQNWDDIWRTTEVQCARMLSMVMTALQPQLSIEENKEALQQTARILYVAEDADEARVFVRKAHPHNACWIWSDCIQQARLADQTWPLTLLGKLANFSRIECSPFMRQQIESYCHALKARLTDFADRADTWKKAGLQHHQHNYNLLQNQSKLTAVWLDSILSEWFVTHHQKWLSQPLQQLRARVERSWFLRNNIKRIYLVCSSNDNKDHLLAACASGVYPNLERTQLRSSVCPMLPGKSNDLAAWLTGKTLLKPLQQAPFSNKRSDSDTSWQQSLIEMGDALNKQAPDLLIIEHWQQIGTLLLDKLRPSASFPVILLTGDRWNEPELSSLASRKIRVIWLPRMSALSTIDCIQQLKLLHTI